MNSNCEMQGNVEFTVESEKCNPKFILKTHDNAGPPYSSTKVTIVRTLEKLSKIDCQYNWFKYSYNAKYRNVCLNGWRLPVLSEYWSSTFFCKKLAYTTSTGLANYQALVIC